MDVKELNISAKWEAYLKELVKRGRFGSELEAIEHALGLLRKCEAKGNLFEMIAEAEEDGLDYDFDAAIFLKRIEHG